MNKLSANIPGSGASSRLSAKGMRLRAGEENKSAKINTTNKILNHETPNKRGPKGMTQNCAESPAENKTKQRMAKGNKDLFLL